MSEINYRPLLAVVGVVLVVGVLLLPVQAFTSDGVAFIDTELRTKDPNARTYVTTKYPVGDSAKLATFPVHMGKWSGTYTHNWSSLAELLGTDVLLARDYRAPGVYLPVTLLIVQSRAVSSFHPAPVCYQSQGYTIIDDQTATVSIPVNDSTWARHGVFEGADQRDFSGSIEAKRLLVEKESPDGAKRRELALYFYMKEERGAVTEKIAWVRVSIPVPATGAYQGHEEILSSFLSDTVPELFDPRPPPEGTTVLGLALSKARQLFG